MEYLISVTKADIDKVVDEGGTKGVEALLNIYESATPIPNPIMDEEQISGYSTSQKERFLYKYNVETSEVTQK